LLFLTWERISIWVCFWVFVRIERESGTNDCFKCDVEIFNKRSGLDNMFQIEDDQRE
jgi:hypothetical protein